MVVLSRARNVAAVDTLRAKEWALSWIRTTSKKRGESVLDFLDENTVAKKSGKVIVTGAVTKQVKTERVVKEMNFYSGAKVTTAAVVTTTMLVETQIEAQVIPSSLLKLFASIALKMQTQAKAMVAFSQITLNVTVFSFIFFCLA